MTGLNRIGRWGLAACAGASLLLAPAANAQGGWSTITRRDSRDLIKQSETKRTGLPAGGATTPLETAIDPATYVLSAGDALTLSIWGPVELLLDLTVTSDGKLIIPSVGILAVDGQNLRATEQLVRDACAGPYPHAEVALSLVRPTMLRIPVTGQVAVPGVHMVLSSSRLSDLLESSGGLSDGANQRAIRLEHSDGTFEDCDLLEWQLDGLDAGNPALRCGDRVHVSGVEQSYRVRGMPHPGSPAHSGSAGPLETETRVIAFRAGDTLERALRASGWPSSSFCDDGVNVARASEFIRVPLADCAEFAMQPGDIVDVPFCREWVSVGGAVVRPGVYPYLPGQTVADYVYLAGGPDPRGRHSGWQILGEDDKRRTAAPSDTVAAGAEIWVNERRAQTFATLLAPIASAVALLVSVVALVQ